MRLVDKKTREITEVADNGFLANFDTLKELTDKYEDAPEEKKYGGRVPRDGDRYWYVSSSAQIVGTTWCDSDCDKGAFECGAAFWTREEAEKELGRRKAYVILKEDTKGFVPDWEDGDEQKYFVGYNWNERLTVDYGWHFQCIAGPYFATREDAKASIKAHPSEWRTWLGVENE